MAKKQPIIAILYDFDKTLATDDMQNFSFIPALGMNPEEFWGATGELTKKTGMEKILSYMYMMITMSKEKGIPLTKEYLNKLGKEVHMVKNKVLKLNTIFFQVVLKKLLKAHQLLKNLKKSMHVNSYLMKMELLHGLR